MKTRNISLISVFSLIFSPFVFAEVQFHRTDINLGSYTDSRIEFADKNNDGYLDAFTFGSNGAGTNIYQNNGTDFSLSYTSLLMGKKALVITDVNLDGFQDVISYPFRISLNDGTGLFSTPTSALAPYSSVAIVELATVDLDNNGIIDLLVSQWSLSGGTTSVYMNVTDDPSKPGNFAYVYSKDYSSQLLNGTTASHRARGAAIGDLNGDGYQDFILINAPDLQFGYLHLGGSAVMLNDGNGGMVPTQFISNSEDIQLGDLDNDGDLDAFLAVGGTQPDEIWFNDGAGHFSKSPQTLVGSNSVSSAIGDLNGDGYFDVVVINNNYLQHQPQTIWLNDGSGQMSKSSFTFGTGRVTKSVTLIDIDQDGDTDIVTMGDHQSDGNNGYLSSSEIWINQLIPDADAGNTVIVDSVIQLCKDHPNDYGLVSQDQLSQAIDDANSAGFESGIQACQDNPHDYSLNNQEDLDNAILEGQVEGIQICIDNPAEFDLFVQTDIDNASADGQAQGKQSCIDNPDSCGLFNQSDLDDQVVTTINQTLVAILSELPRGQIVSICKKNPASLLCKQFSDKKDNKNGKKK